MKSDSLSAEEICKIIETCAKRGVSKLKLGALELNFGPLPTTRKAPGPATPAPASAAVQAEQTQEQERALTKDEVELREEQLAELQLTNPAEYERLIASGQIELDEELDGAALD